MLFHSPEMRQHCEISVAKSGILFGRQKEMHSCYWDVKECRLSGGLAEGAANVCDHHQQLCTCHLTVALPCFLCGSCPWPMPLAL